MSVNQTEHKIITIAKRLYEESKEIRFGSISITLTIHDGRVVKVTDKTEKNTQEQIEEK